VPAGTHGPLCACSAKEIAQRHTGEAVHTAFPAQWSDGLCRALPGAEFLLASLTPRIDDAVRPVGLARIFEGLDRSNDGQDHTSIFWHSVKHAETTKTL